MFMGNKQRDNEDFKSLIDKVQTIIIQDVIINIPTASVYYENVNACKDRFNFKFKTSFLEAGCF